MISTILHPQIPALVAVMVVAVEVSDMKKNERSFKQYLIDLAEEDYKNNTEFADMSEEDKVKLGMLKYMRKSNAAQE